MNKRAANTESPPKNAKEPNILNKPKSDLKENETRVDLNKNTAERNFDDFDHIPSRKRRQKDTQHQEATTQGTAAIDDFDDIPKRSRRREARPADVVELNETEDKPEVQPGASSHEATAR